MSSILFEKKKNIIKKIEQRILEVEPDTRKELRSILCHIQETMNLDEDWEDQPHMSDDQLREMANNSLSLLGIDPIDGRSSVIFL